MLESRKPNTKIKFMSLVASTQRLIKYSQDLAAENALLKQSEAYKLAEIADLKQQLTNALANDASDAETIKVAQSEADAAKTLATEAQTSAVEATAKIAELQDKISELEAQIEATALIDAHLNGGDTTTEEVSSEEVSSEEVKALIDTALPLEVTEPVVLG